MKSFALVTFGTVIPTLGLLLELVTGACGEVFFDPIPTWWHVGLVAFVPLANLVAATAIRADDEPGLPLIVCNGLALGIAAFYVVAMFEIIPLGFVGLLFFGAGTIPLSPLLSFLVAAALAGSLYRHAWQLAGKTKLLWFLTAAAVGGVLALGPFAPAALTDAMVARATRGTAEQRSEALRFLRRYGSRQEMLKLCYQRPTWNLRGWDASQIRSEDARRTYFAVTGEPFNHLPKPHIGGLLMRSAQFDSALGGDEVAGNNPYVRLTSSRMDVEVVPEDALAYTEWTFDFRNDHAVTEQEARFQVQLPPNAVVSRLTLWVNGEPREAAFSSTGSVRAAYREVAVIQRRDPVLVTWKGLDRALVQCFPIPPDGGRMKIRLGMTAPLQFQDQDGMLRLPRIVERNFQPGDGDTLRDEAIHAIWAEAPCTISGEWLPPGGSSTPSRTRLVGTISDAQLRGHTAVIRVPNGLGLTRPATISDKTAAPIHVVRRAVAKPTEQIICVIDGSLAMRDAVEEVLAALGSWSSNTTQCTVLIAGDEVLGPFAPGAELAAALRSSLGIGGCDNVPALLRGWELTDGTESAAIVWIHGPQPAELQALGTIDQRFALGSSGVRLFDVEFASGPNRVLQRESAFGHVDSVIRTTSLADDLSGLFRELQVETASAHHEWVDPLSEHVPDETTTTPHERLVDLWAAHQVERAFARGARQEANQLAAAHHIVSPVSGAVVLETAEQFKAAGLVPVDAVDKLPITTPEPGTGLLAVLGVLGLLDWCRRRNRGLAFRR